MPPNEEQVYEIATRNRLLAAGMFADLSEDQWRTPSLCAGWTVREVCAHLVPPERELRPLTVLGVLVRYRGDLARWVDEETRREARRPTAELVARLRDRADMRRTPPIIGARGPMVDTAIHLRDAARPLGLEVNPPPADWLPVLDFLVTKPAERGFVGRGRTSGLRLEADDIDWNHGEGDLVRGPAEALALGIAGRSVALADLSGPGVDALRPAR